MYFLLSLIAYLFYIKKQDFRYLLLSVLLFVFSLLSKAQAVTLPLILVLVDYLLSRKTSLKTILEKVPFFILSLAFGILAIRAQDADSSINPIGIPVFHSLFYAQYSVWVYLVKTVLPVYQTCLYEYPVNAAGNPPFYIYLSPLILPVIGYVLYKTWRTHKYVTFGVLFFLFTIFPVLQFLPVGQAIVAERYTYVPYIGLFIIAGIFLPEYRDKVKGATARSALTWSGFVVLALLALLTFNRTKVWFDSVSLWTDVLEKNPKSITAYVNRGYMYNQYNEYDLAIRDCNEGIKLDSNHFKFYVNRAVSYRSTGRFDLAFADFNKAIQKNPKNYESYLDRGILYTDQFNKYDSGIADFRIYMRFRPTDVNCYYNMAVAFYKKKVYDSALVYCRKGMEITPSAPGPYYIMALVSDARGDYANAALFGSKAKELGYAVDDALIENWRTRSGTVPVNLAR
jgi:Tfp pilus assembly protein PilF